MRFLQIKTLILIFILICSCEKIDPKTITVAIVAPPISTDPLDYDYSVSHNTMRSVFASLVSNYQRGAITPQIAKSWTHSDDFKIWDLVIDENWTFENGDKVTPDIVSKNFKRLILIKNKTNSKSGLLEFVKGSKYLNSINQNIDGIQIDGNRVKFIFDKEMKDFLSKISFGIYGITHPGNYDETGQWIDKKKIISSSFYKITKWNDKEFVIKKRDDFYLKNNDLIDEIRFIFPKSMDKVEDSQLIFNDNLHPNLNEKEWTFESSALDNKIIYIQLMDWKNKKSVYGHLEKRKLLRSLFYEILENNNQAINTSFFPTTIKGVYGFNDYKIPHGSNLTLNLNKIRTQYFSTTEYQSTGKRKSQADVLFELIDGFSKKINAKLEFHEYPANYEDEDKVFDIIYRSTGINIDEPFEDIKFMFLSKQGIMLPDENGKIHKILASNFNVQEINQELWNQAIIWPIKHFSTGFWIRKNTNIDISNLNILLTPIDFQFVKWK